MTTKNVHAPLPAPEIAPHNLNDYIYLFFAPIQEFFSDDDVSEILINGPHQIYIEKKGQLHHVDAHFVSEDALKAATVNVARAVGRLLNDEYPVLDARLPDGSRVSAIIPPVSRVGTVVSIRKFSKDKLSMQDLVRFGSIDEAGAALLEIIVKLHRNVIVSGATSSGKTSVLNVMSSFISQEERILVIEDSTELQLQQDHVVNFETRKPDRTGHGAISIRDLVQASLRLRPDRLVIGEVRGGEAIDLLQALNTGHSGSMSTIHANTAVDSLLRLETCALMSGIEMPLSALRAQVAAGIQVVVQTARLSDGARKITGISEVSGLENGEYIVEEIYRFRQDRIDPDGHIVGAHVGCGHKPSFFDDAAQHHLSIQDAWFDAEK